MAEPVDAKKWNDYVKGFNKALGSGDETDEEKKKKKASETLAKNQKASDTLGY